MKHKSHPFHGVVNICHSRIFTRVGHEGGSDRACKIVAPGLEGEPCEVDDVAR